MSNLNLEFKNVNQGDSIVISWGNNPIRYGIVDCNCDNGNPVLEHFKKLECNELEFIILSHPHTDHYSGFVDFLKHLKAEGIKVKTLAWTFDNVICPVFIKYYSTSKQRMLHDFLEAIFQDKDSANPVIQRWLRIDMDTSDYKLGENISLSFRSPNPMEIGDYSRKMAKVLTGKAKGIPDLNLFASIIEIKVLDKAVILTSDAPKIYFERLVRYYQRLETIFSLVQIPHHGSTRNYIRAFWENLKHIELCPAVFSVGDNKHDRLPNAQVVKDIVDFNYDVYATNEVYGIKEILGSGTTTELPLMFDLVSKPILRQDSPLPTKLQGNQHFAF